jgi:hypothetical protein
MKALRLFLLCAMAGAGASSVARAADKPARAAPAKAGLRELFGLSWQPTLDAARAEDRRTQPGRPIVLLRVLGDLDDKL